MAARRVSYCLEIRLRVHLVFQKNYWRVTAEHSVDKCQFLSCLFTMVKRRQHPHLNHTSECSSVALSRQRRQRYHAPPEPSPRAWQELILLNSPWCSFLTVTILTSGSLLIPPVTATPHAGYLPVFLFLKTGSHIARLASNS